eukprot:76516-Alexandrium_andersonii.AAC.1
MQECVHAPLMTEWATVSVQEHCLQPRASAFRRAAHATASDEEREANHEADDGADAHDGKHIKDEVDDGADEHYDKHIED